MKSMFNKCLCFNRDFQIIEGLTFNDKGRILEILKFLTKHGDIKYNNRKDSSPLKIEDACKMLILSKKRLLQYFKKMEDCSVLKYKLIENDSIHIIFNPTLGVFPNFILSVEMFDIFEKDILKNIDFFHENISAETFRKYRNKIKENMNSYLYSLLDFKFSDYSYRVYNYEKEEGGIYILYLKDDVIYVGKSVTNIKNRVVQHRKDKEFDIVKSIVFKDKGLINLYEPYFIQKYKPIYNKDLLEEMEFNLPEIKL